MYIESHLAVCYIEKVFFFFNDTATTEIYTLSLHDALPICLGVADHLLDLVVGEARARLDLDLLLLACAQILRGHVRSEEHTSELQSRQYLVCRLLLEKKNKYPLVIQVIITIRKSHAVRITY